MERRVGFLGHGPTPTQRGGLDAALATLAIIAVSAASGGLAGCGGRTCAKGTLEKAGACVPDPNAQVRCGEGSVLVLHDDGGRCEPVAVCGDGTRRDETTNTCVSVSECGPGTILDLLTGDCEPQAECGPSTVENEDLGTCESVIVCGEGTTLDADAKRCVGPPPCTGGAVFNDETAQCESDLVCGADLLVIDGRCVTLPESVALDADLVEPAPDENDPARGGSPIPVALDLGDGGAGDGRTVLVGTIGRIADEDTGALSQDRDVWRFSADAGTAWHVQVFSFGLDEPVFTLRGPGGFRRASTVGFEAEPARDVILPRNGEYDVEVTAGQFVQTGVPTGSSTARYIVVITPLTLPAQEPIAPGAGFLDPAVASGAFADLSVIAVTAAPGTPIVAELIDLDELGAGYDFAPALFALDDDNRVIAESRVLDRDLSWLALVQPEVGHLRVVIDWTEATEPLGDWQLALFEVPSVSDTLEPVVRRDSTTIDIPHETWSAFLLDVEAEQVIDFEIFAAELVISPDVMVVGPDGSSTFEDEDAFFFFARPQRYTVFVRNETISPRDYTGAFLRMIGSDVVDLGPVGVNDTLALTGPDVEPGFGGLLDVWARVDVTEPIVLESRLTLAGGQPSVSFVGLDGVVLRDHVVKEHGTPTSVLVADARPLLVRVSPSAFGSALRPMVDWRLALAGAAVPDVLDVEPNDEAAQAVPLGDVATGPIAARGFIDDDEIDLWSFSVSTRAPGQAVRILVESLNGNRNGFSSDDERTLVRVLDADGSLALTLPASDAGLQGASHEMYLADADGTGTFFLEIEGTSFADQIAEYRIALALVSAQGEVEPNDGFDAATPLSFPLLAYGARDPGGADEDCFAFSLPAPMAVDDSLRVSLDNMLSTSSTVSELRLHAAGGALIATAVATFPRVIAANLSAGPLVACAARDPDASSQSAFTYRLRAEIGPAAERASNDVVGESVQFDASVLDGVTLVDGTIASAVHNNTTGTDLPGDPDRFAIEGNGAGTCLRVRALNLTSTRTLILEGSAGQLDEDTVPEVLTVAALDGAPVAVSDLVTVNQASDGSLADRVTVDNYRLVARAAGACEAEPNDVAAGATSVVEGAALLAHVRFGDVDMFAWDAPSISAGEALVLRAQNLSDASPLGVRALDDVEAELASDEDDAVELRLAGPRGAGRVYLELAHSATAGKSGDVVAVEVLRD